MSALRKRLFEIVEVHGDSDRAGRLFKLFIMGLIALSVVSVILETVSALEERWGAYFRAFEVLSVLVFSVEYVGRLWSCTEDERFRHPLWGRLRFACTFMALVDLTAILPFYLPMVTTLDLRFVRALRLLRLLRLFKIGRYSESLKIMGSVFRNKKEELFITLFVALILLVIVSSLMFFIENTVQPKVFSSIPAAMWWGVATLTTIGYGDIFPVTLAGKVLGGLSALLGIGMFALPAGILGSAFIEELHKSRATAKSCPHCGKEIKD